MGAAAHKDSEDAMQDTHKWIILDSQLKTKQDIIRTFQRALNTFGEGGKILTQVAQRDGRCPMPHPWNHSKSGWMEL